MDNYNQQLESIYAPQEAFIQKQIAELPSQYEPQKAAIEQAKINAFRDIQKESFKRGRFFGGFQPAEQARYLGERYLPGLQQLTLSQQQAQQGLLGKMVELQAARATSRLNYAEQLRKEQVAAQQAEQQFQRQLALQRAQASYSGGGGSSAAEAKQTINEVGSYLKGRVGRDGKVSPSTFQQGRQMWVAAGGDPTVYAQTFLGYINKSHIQDYIGK